MLEMRASQDRGHANHGWLDSYHSFSFADYFDPAHVQFGPLRVINEDWVAPGRGFATHGHRDMEIITYVLQGALSHKDSMGNGSTIRPGDVQRMSAGRGIMHSEFNHDPQAMVHLLQIWILPNQLGIEPSYEEKHFDANDKRGRLKLVASADGREGSVLMHQNASLYVGLFDGDDTASLQLAPQRQAYVHLARGQMTVNGVVLKAGDALKVSDEPQLNLSNGLEAEVLVFDLPVSDPVR